MPGATADQLTQAAVDAIEEPGTHRLNNRGLCLSIRKVGGYRDYFYKLGSERARLGNASRDHTAKGWLPLTDAVQMAADHYAKRGRHWTVNFGENERRQAAAAEARRAALDEVGRCLDEATDALKRARAAYSRAADADGTATEVRPLSKLKNFR